MLPVRARERDSQVGMTLIEVLAATVILTIVTTMLIVGWINLQGASATVTSTSTARGTCRDAIARISSELRGCQPTALPSPTASASPLPPLTDATKYSVAFSSAYNSSGANADGSGVGALRSMRIWLGTSAQTAPWNPLCKTLYLQQDVNLNGSFTDAGDRSTVLARNVANERVPDTTNGTAYTALFRYAYRDGDSLVWTDSANSVLSSVVAVSVRLIIDAKMGGKPKYIDTATTVRLRNASID